MLKVKSLTLDKKIRKKLLKKVNHHLSGDKQFSPLLPPGHSIQDVDLLGSADCLLHKRPLMECLVAN